MFKNVALDQINIDPSYQRALVPGWVRKLALNWDDDQYDPIKLSLRTDGKFYAIGGQHRIEAARLLGKTGLLARIFTNLTREREAEIFKLDGTNHRRPKPMDLHRAGLTAQHEIDIDAETIADQFNFVLRGGGGSAQASTSSVQTIIGFVKQDATTLVSALKAMKEAWYSPQFGWAPDALSGKAIRGVFEVLRRYPNIDHERLVKTLFKITPQFARNLHTSGRPVPDAIVDAYNKGLASNSSRRLR